MKLAREHAKTNELDWREILAASFELGLPSLFNIEWLIDKPQSSEWSGIWW